MDSLLMLIVYWVLNNTKKHQLKKKSIKIKLMGNALCSGCQLQGFRVAGIFCKKKHQIIKCNQFN